ncbi:hypothetical protein SLA2020_180290 [Shorea laevis]
MEPSKMFGGTEECHSSESGWTMYIGSPVHDDDDGSNSDAKAHDTAEDDGGADDDGDSDANDDDSMASDASSGPSHEMVRLKHGEDDEGDDGKSYSYMDNKKTNKPMEKQNMGKNKSPKKNDKRDMAGSSAAPSQSGSKVRKSFWHPKRK